MDFNAKIVKTNDGTDTIYLPDLDEHYHSTHGARQESEHVYLKCGLDYYVKRNISDKKKQIQILEIGFGTGLNALLTCMYAQQHKIPINYITLEPFPLKKEYINQLNFNLNQYEATIFKNIHHVKWNKKNTLNEYFSITKWKLKLEDFKPSNLFNIIYFDAFAPSKQKNIWSPGNFSTLYNVLTNESGILTTYCAQGQFKRTAKNIGFSIELIDGPPGKREMIRLTKK